MLSPGVRVTTASGKTYRLGKAFAPGGQGQVFLVEGHPLVAKFYHPNRVQGEARALQLQRLKRLMVRPPPSRAFVWPIDIVESPFLGYLMERVPADYESLTDLDWNRVTRTDVRSRLRICYRLTEAFYDLHLKEGYAYCDLARDNVLCVARSGDIRIIDNDNLTVDGLQSPLGVTGTYRFIAPELEEGSSSHPDISTDLHSLAVLLFETLLLHHPLLGDRILEGSAEKEKQALGASAVYIYHPTNHSNRYTKYDKFGGVPITVLPRSLRRLFEDAFTKGLHNPTGRLHETRWRRAIINELDLLIRCSNRSCFWHYTYMPDTFQNGDTRVTCKWCGHSISGIHLMQLKGTVASEPRRKVVSADQWLSAHHCKITREFDFTPGNACAKIESDAQYGLTLRNVTKETFLYYPPGAQSPVEFLPDTNVKLHRGCRIQFGADGTLAEMLS